MTATSITVVLWVVMAVELAMILDSSSSSLPWSSVTVVVDALANSPRRISGRWISSPSSTSTLGLRSNDNARQSFGFHPKLRLSSTSIQLDQEESYGGGKKTESDIHQTISASSIFLDLGVDGEGGDSKESPSIGRLVFHLSSIPVEVPVGGGDSSDTATMRFYHPLPVHTENFIQLIKGSYRGLDPRCHYVGCTFDFNPNTVEMLDQNYLNGRYKWTHSCVGRRRNVVTTRYKSGEQQQRDQPIKDPISTRQCTHSCFGGQYYGWKYDNNDEEEQEDYDPNVMLCVSVAGPNYGSTKFAIVRVGESPPEWKERLLLNTGVIGKMDPSCYDVLLKLARQTKGPPKIVASGIC